MGSPAKSQSWIWALTVKSICLQAGGQVLHLVRRLAPRRLVVLVKDTRTQFCQQNHEAGK